MQLTNQQISNISRAITLLDGSHVLQVIEGKAVQVFHSFTLAHTARWALARAQGLLQVAEADFNRAKDALILHHSGGTGALGPQSEGWKPFAQELAKLTEQKVEVPIEQIDQAHLKLEENEKAGREVPIAVLHALLPLIKS